MDSKLIKWNELLEQGDSIIKNRKVVFGEYKWLSYIKKFNKIKKESPSDSKIEDLRRIISGLSSD